MSDLNKNSYKHLFFDLDHTLWDTEKNAYESLGEIYIEFNLSDADFPSFNDFYSCYRDHNEKLWGLYAENKIGRDAVRINRFRFALEDFQIHDYDLAEKIADEFIKRTPHKKHLIPDSIFVLDKLSEKYKMSIITNGFMSSQHIKMEVSGINKYFENIFVSEDVGFNKPDPRIFHHALRQSGVDVTEAIMIGDTYETDILGARSAGIDQVYFRSTHPEEHTATFKISALKNILEII